MLEKHQDKCIQEKSVFVVFIEAEQMLTGQMLLLQISPWQLYIVKDYLIKLLLKFGQNLVSTSGDIADIMLGWVELGFYNCILHI